MRLFFCLLAGLSFPAGAWAQVELPKIFSHHMVLQRGLPIPVWGTAVSGASLELSLGQYLASTKAGQSGNWRATLPPMQAGGPYELAIRSEGETIRLEDIYIGEVWLCSGQSNMEWPLEKCATGPEEIPQAGRPLLRFFQMKKKHPLDDTPFSDSQLGAFTKGAFFHPAKWERCTPETAAPFSGVAYFFGKALQDSLKMAVGLVLNAVGGSPAQSWISEAALAAHPQLEFLVNLPPGKSWLELEGIHPWLAVRARENWAGWKGTEGEPALPGHPFAPSYLYENAIKPIAPYAIRGATWYQGESNATHPGSYFAMMEAMLACWRRLWGQGDFPFLFVQLPAIGNRSLWPEFREAQGHCLSLPNTGMVVAIDEGHPTDVHPREKKVIGQRLAGLALARAYGRDILTESPVLAAAECSWENRQATLFFRNTGDGLKTADGKAPEGFTFQGYTTGGAAETILLPEKIIIEKNTVKLTWPDGFLPVMVKYGWAPAPVNNMANSAGLPIAPFRAPLPGNN